MRYSHDPYSTDTCKKLHGTLPTATLSPPVSAPAARNPVRLEDGAVHFLRYPQLHGAPPAATLSPPVSAPAARNPVRLGHGALLHFSNDPYSTDATKRFGGTLLTSALPPAAPRVQESTYWSVISKHWDANTTEEIVLSFVRCVVSCGDAIANASKLLGCEGCFIITCDDEASYLALLRLHERFASHPFKIVARGQVQRVIWMSSLPPAPPRARLRETAWTVFSGQWHCTVTTNVILAFLRKVLGDTIAQVQKHYCRDANSRHRVHYGCYTIVCDTEQTFFALLELHDRYESRDFRIVERTSPRNPSDHRRVSFERPKTVT